MYIIKFADVASFNSKLKKKKKVLIQQSAGNGTRFVIRMSTSSEKVTLLKHNPTKVKNQDKHTKADLRN